MDQIENLKQEKFAELQQQAAQQQQTEQQILQLENLVKSKMTKQAVQRYSNLKSAHPEKTMQILYVLAQLIQAQQINIIDDQHLKMLLTKINPQKHKFKITRR